MSYSRDSSKDLVWDENSNSYVSESAEPTTIAEAIAAAQQRVAAVYTAISNKGGTLPATQNLSNLPTAIDSIPSGGGGQTYSYPNLIGNYFVLDDDSVVPICFDTVGVNGENYSSVVLLETPNGLRYISYGSVDTRSAASPGTFNNYTWSTSGTGWLGNHTIKHISFGFLSTLTTDVIFTGSFSDGGLPIANTLTSIKIYNMDQLAIRIAFKGCTNLREVDVSTVDSIPVSMALGGSNAVGGAFTNCTSLQNIYWSSLKTTSFGSSYKNQFNNMLKGVTGCTLHFPSNLETTISGLTGYPNFGGTDTILLFDLPATS